MRIIFLTASKDMRKALNSYIHSLMKNGLDILSEDAAIKYREIYGRVIW